VRDVSQGLSVHDLGEPALRVAGLQIWIHGREFPEAADERDANWLNVTAHCGAHGSAVWAQGTMLEITDLEGFAGACEALLRGEAAAAVLDPFEPNLHVTIEASDRYGRFRARVDLTPDHLAQAHSVQFDIDQSYLPSIVEACNRIVREYRTAGALDQTAGQQGVRE
jgi:hypothetical protein